MSAEILKTVDNESKSHIISENLNRIVEKLQMVFQEPAIREFRADTELVKGI